MVNILKNIFFAFAGILYILAFPVLTVLTWLIEAYIFRELGVSGHLAALFYFGAPLMWWGILYDRNASKK
ncbi:hypothetical protein DNI29_03420 [Hymenobacter sediminis]|uniref:hypothetical protein n=1 Tax=Hymenobacter sediminis TaxID=2218621 RepID=UPI000DA69E8E|nr:hypothetical protein [Hymenobacter sediminis]RPD49860.1 hypothetical protein DNI29_03420 [Hymenobacter sediminis]